MMTIKMTARVVLAVAVLLALSAADGCEGSAGDGTSGNSGQNPGPTPGARPADPAAKPGPRASVQNRHTHDVYAQVYWLQAPRLMTILWTPYPRPVREVSGSWESNITVVSHGTAILLTVVQTEKPSREQLGTLRGIIWVDHRMGAFGTVQNGDMLQLQVDWSRFP